MRVQRTGSAAVSAAAAGAVLLSVALVSSQAGATERGITGKKLLLKSSPPKMVLLSKDTLVVPGAAASFADPRCNPAGSDLGGSVTLDDGTNRATLSMPCVKWSATTAGTYKYNDSAGTPKLGKLKVGVLKILSPGLGGFPVPNGAATVRVEVTVGADKYCMSFSGTGDGRKFQVKDAVTGACPSPTATATVTPTPSSTGTPTNTPTATNTRYPATDLYVSSSAAVNGDGHLASPYRRITDAVTHARDERATELIDPAQAIRIHVAPGTYVGSFDAAALRDHPDYEVLPIILNVPKLSLLGGTVLLRDGRNLPTATEPGTDTSLQPDTHLLANQYLFLVTRTADGSAGDDVTIDGFAIDGIAGDFPGAAVVIDRVAGFTVSNNLVEGAAFGVMTRLASGRIEGNLLTNNLELGSAVTGGSATYPASVVIHANRANANGAHGLAHVSAGWIRLLSDPGQNTVPLLEPLQTVFDRNLPQDLANIPDTLTATLTGNDASDNGVGTTLGGIGIRFGNIWPDFDYQTIDSSQPLTSVLHASLIDNTATGNAAYGVDIEAGDTKRLEFREFHQSVDASFAGNVFTGNGRANGLFTFTYWLASVDSSRLYVQKYAQESTYALTANDGELVPFDYDDPLTDPIVGTTLDDTLTLNGVAVPHGQSISPPN